VAVPGIDVAFIGHADVSVSLDLHAAVAGLMLRTRDAQRYRTYLPTVELIAP